MKKIYHAANYGRLSREDGDNLESESITNQKNCLRDYIDKREDLILIDEYFSISDGVGETDFNLGNTNKSFVFS